MTYNETVPSWLLLNLKVAQVIRNNTIGARQGDPFVLKIGEERDLSSKT